MSQDTSSKPTWVKRLFLMLKQTFRAKHQSPIPPAGIAQPQVGVQWKLDASYSEGPQYHSTVVYVDHHDDTDNTKENASYSNEDLTKRITHYPPTHRLH